jgi:hypothetical protein
MLLRAVLALLLILPVSLAHAQDVPDDETPVVPAATPATHVDPPPPAEAPPRTRWYGWQIMLSDVSCFVLAGALHGEGGELASLGLLFGPAVIHLQHGRTGTALTSVILRGAMPAGGAIAGLLIGAYIDGRSDDPDSNYGLAGLAFGMIGGGLSALVIDYTILSAADPEPRPSSLAWGLAPRSGGLVLSLGGSF